MAKFNSFEEIIGWQKARTLCKLINEYTLKVAFAKNFKLVSQIKGSSGSAMDNIAEGFERGGNRELINFLSFSKGSAGETRSQLYRALDNGYISKDEFKKACDLADEVGKLIGGLMGHLKSTDLKENKFK